MEVAHDLQHSEVVDLIEPMEVAHDIDPIIASAVNVLSRIPNTIPRTLPSILPNNLLMSKKPKSPKAQEILDIIAEADEADQQFTYNTNDKGDSI
jgi:hypothetical protein